MRPTSVRSARVHGELFAEARPANTSLVVAALLNPAWKVEIEVEAVRADIST